VLCLLLADGFYENGILFRLNWRGVFCLAGLWREESGVKRHTLLTTSWNESVAKHHDRMPFILRSVQYDSWLGKDWQQILTAPDHAPLEKFEKHLELFG
jgi:putative SOS response-associated peptidase YedK